jgi:hypothetical protein
VLFQLDGFGGLPPRGCPAKTPNFALQKLISDKVFGCRIFGPAGARNSKKGYTGHAFWFLGPNKFYLSTKIFRNFALKKLIFRTTLGVSFTGPLLPVTRCSGIPTSTTASNC